MAYSVRVTEQDGKVIAWIDRDGQPCIEQPNHPAKLSTGENWTSVAEAQAWADEHYGVLIASETRAAAAVVAKADADALDIAAKEAAIANVAKLASIESKLDALLAK